MQSSSTSAKFAAYQKLLIIKKIRELSAPEIAFMQTYKEEHEGDAERAQKKVSEPNPDEKFQRFKDNIEQEALQEKAKIEQEALQDTLNTQQEALRREREALRKKREERERNKLAERTQKREQNRSTPVVSASLLESLE